MPKADVVIALLNRPTASVEMPKMGRVFDGDIIEHYAFALAAFHLIPVLP